MIKKELKTWILPVLGLVVLFGAAFCYYLLYNLKNYDLVGDQSYVTDVLVDKTIEVNKEIESTIIKPFDNNEVTISKNYYNSKDSKEKQQKSLIRYENIYMPNTGILYTSSKEFNVLAVLDGKVSSVKNDDILGYVIEIEHANNLVTIYQSVNNVKIKEGDTVKQGDIIATSGKNKLKEEKDNCLHFEVYKNGNLINPEEFYQMNINSKE